MCHPGTTLQTPACAIQERADHFVVHDSDPDLAFEACTMSRSHTLLDGLLYKCPMVAILPRFRKQYDVELSDQQKALLESYQPLAHTCSDQDLQEFLLNENLPIAQCNLCPSDGVFSPVTFDPQRKHRQRKQGNDHVS